MPELTLLTVECVVTTAAGQQHTYRLSYLMDETARGNRAVIVYRKEHEMVDMMLSNDHLWGSMIGPLRVSERPATVIDYSTQCEEEPP